MVKRLLDDGHKIVVVDNLARGHREAVDTRAELFVGDLLNKSFLSDVFSKNKFDGIIHFAGLIAVGESMEQPALYYENNTFATLNLLEEARQHKVDKIIFSSTAAIYGDPVKVPINEDHPKNPTSVYGESKLFIENILNWYQQIYGISSVSLRYFNASGAALDGSLGEGHIPETHIIPCAIQAILQQKPFTLFGTDYDTPDGTCVRDYIHVLDLIEAHVLALGYLGEHKGNFAFNVGTGKGYSNSEIIEAIKKVSGMDLQVSPGPKRAGDADTLIADSTKIKTDLLFSPKYSELETIIKSAWKWHKKNEK
jgi:UDP-glucose 4-epimerase